MGPCPPPGKAHHYEFMLYALDAPLDLEEGATQDELADAMRGREVGKAVLTGFYARGQE
jgi:phosphatidylethanolamine-binding protein (PEBP) family uncharacterized protein